MIFLPRGVDVMRWFPIAFLTNGVFLVTLAGFELTTLALGVRTLSHYTTAPFNTCHASYNVISAGASDASKVIGKDTLKLDRKRLLHAIHFTAVDKTTQFLNSLVNLFRVCLLVPNEAGAILLGTNQLLFAR